MLKKIFSFFIAFVSFILSLFGIGSGSSDNNYVFKDLRYGSSKEQTLDLYIPKDAKKTCGLVLFLHGGTWIDGDKAEIEEETLKSFCNDLGYATATMNYRRVSSRLSASDVISDIDLALLKIKETGNNYETNINRVLLYGKSAGGHLALLYGYSKTMNAPMKISAIVAESAPSDLSDKNFYSAFSTLAGSKDEIYSLMSNVCGKKFNEKNFARAVSKLKEVSPITYVSSNCPPTLLAHGKKDSVVPFTNAMVLDSALSTMKVKHDFVVFENSGHDLSGDSKKTKELKDLTSGYIKNYLK